MNAASPDNNPHIVAALQRLTLFRGVSAEALSRLAASCEIISVPRGNALFRRGEPATDLYALVRGRVMLSVGVARDASKVIDIVGPGGHIGLASAVLGSTQTATAETLADSKIVIVPRAALLECAGVLPDLGLQLAASLSRQVCGLIADVEAYSLSSGRSRVANYLLQVASAHGARQRPVPLPAKKSVIASRLSLTPEYFSRMLHELITCGAIAVDGRQITVLDSARLRQCD